MYLHGKRPLRTVNSFSLGFVSKIKRQIFFDLGYKGLMKIQGEELWEGTSVELLKALHILTRDGKLNADSRRKLKQVHHLTRLIEPALQKLIEKNETVNLVDVGAGKSYLGFILYDLILQNHPRTKLIAIESREELVEKSRKLANDSNFQRMEFLHSKVESVQLKDPIHLLCALHACDTATDDAILLGLRHQAQVLALVPCCQAEVASQLRLDHPLVRHPLHRREFGSHLTNVIRTLFLNSQGYKVTVTELVGWEHSMKNEFILAEKVSGPDHPESLKAKAHLSQLMNEFQVVPSLLRHFKTTD